MHPLSNLVDGTPKINGFGGLYSWPLGYVIIRVQVEGVKGYDEDQVALVIPDLTAFRSRVPVTLGTLTINQIVNIIKESEIDELSVSLSELRISCLLAGCWVVLSLKNNITTRSIPDPTDINEAVKMMKQEEIGTFLSQIVHGHTKIVLWGSSMYMTTQAPEKGEEPCLPHGLCLANTYIEMTIGSKCVATVIKNQMDALITIGKGIKIAWMVAANRVPLVEVVPRMLDKLEEMQGIQQTQISTEQRKEMFLQQLDLSGLEGMSGANQVSAHALLIKYHIFLVKPRELGYTSLAKHWIWLVNDELFEERFQRIPPPMIEEVRTNMKQMLEVGAICPSQSPWCNTVMLIRKDRGLHFCIDFYKLNARTKTDSYPLLHIQKAL